MFQLSNDEYSSLKSQFVTSKTTRGGKQKLPLVFTENGLAMLSGILNSERLDAIEDATPTLTTNRRKIGLKIKD